MQAAIFVYVWPEPRSSAAGVRTVQLCRDLMALGYAVTAYSPCKENVASAELAALGIKTQPCPANDSSVDAILGATSTDLVIYDRFVMEEQMGWRARAAWPQALHVVDTQDLHSVRRARERRHAAGQDVMSLRDEDFSPNLERELASLYRADAALVVSPWEKGWLIERGYPAERVFWLPWGVEPEKNTPAFGERTGFAFLGNFRHPPNLDAVNFLAHDLWPEIRRKLPSAKLFLYGAYPPASASALHRKNGIEVPGSVENHRAALPKHRVLLAPLRFGAGIKGKILEAWATGTPVVGTPVAMEGLSHPACRENFVEQAVRLHEEEKLWEEAKDAGANALAPFSPQTVRTQLADLLQLGFKKKEEWRAEIIGRMLRHHQSNSTKYFSRWIEAKNSRA